MHTDGIFRNDVGALPTLFPWVAKQEQWDNRGGWK